LVDLDSIAPEVLDKIQATWPGPVTWVFPAAKQIPQWISGEHNSVAIRVSAHPLVQALCNSYGKAIVSTSANLSGCAPARTVLELQQQFPQGIDCVVPGEVGGMAKPTPIYDAMTGEAVR
jgi:L-threonylcarbamoyladenylate synthase